ncbi:MAG: metallophosphoesterase [Chitinophagaceae bacterium]|nr:metallophosphoesterase [Chitinophagaceae bacterium]
MKRILLFFVPLILSHQVVKAQVVNGSDTITRRIILIGDAGQLTNGRHPVVDAARNLIPLDEKTTVLFLGDNLYKRGLPDAEYDTYLGARAVLDSQLSLVAGTKSQLWMIPGNHDWENGGRDGFNAILRQQLYVSFLAYRNPNIHYEPQEGCPGPVEVQVDDNVTLILFDSQWFLHPYDKPEIESDCNCKTTDEVAKQIGDIAARNAKKLVILACHHPFKSNGIHGGYFSLKQHIFPLTDMKKNLYVPLPLIGSIYPISRSVFGTPQDIKFPAYTNMINEISEEVKKNAPNLLFVSGHDHNLQLIRDSTYNYIVSGGGCKQNRTAKSKKSLFNNTSEGFSVLEISKNKNVTITFYTVGDSVVKYPPFTLLNFATPAARIDSMAAIRVDDPFLKYKDTITTAIKPEFTKAGAFKKLFMGNNYRKEWSTPVNMKVFNLQKEKGGFTITGLGGGTQAVSLNLKNKKDKKDYTLRVVDKNPGQTIPTALRGSLATSMEYELKTATMPYGSMIVPGLTSALHIAAPNPELFFIPDDPALGFYRDIFRNKVVMLEKKDPTFDGSNARATAKIFNEMIDEPDHRPLQEEALKARLLDMIIADYDRHLGQWKWDTQDTGKGKVYSPIPKDRDQAFFYSNGLMMKFLTRGNLPFLKGFRSNIPKVNWLNYTARDFDRIYLTDLDEKDWQKQISQVKQQLTDSVIEAAVKKLPKEIYPLHGETIAKKMISRRNLIETAAMSYYRFLSGKVNIIGTNKSEIFRVSNTADGKLQVRVLARERSDTSFTMYDRIFDPKITKEIRMFGLNDKDVFIVDSNTHSTIKLRMVGGQDYDTFDIRGKVEALLYDTKDTGNYIRTASHAKNRFSSNSPVNEKSLFNFNYNYSKFPQLSLDFNSDDHFYMGAGFSRRTFGFRNLPYATDQNLRILYAVEHNAWQLNYSGEFNHITRNIDLVLKANAARSALRNFYGLGNHVELDKNKPDNYYQVRYRKLEFEALIRKRFFDKFHIMAGPYYNRYSATQRENLGNVFAKPGAVGLDSASIFSVKSYLGAKMVLLADNRNNTFWPSRGILWQNTVFAQRGLNDNSRDLIGFTSDMTIYASFADPAKLIAVLKVGGGHLFNRNFEYFQALTLGMNNGLRGFRKDRYMGRANFYSGLELRVKLGDVNSYFIPGQIGLLFFGDVGKVHSRFDETRRWHGAYGAGIYYLPFNLFAITGSIGFHSDEKSLNFSVGTRFNLVY